MTPDEVLEQAADDISLPGHWKKGGIGRYWEPDAPVCALGAIHRACGRNHLLIDVAVDAAGKAAAEAADWTHHIGDILSRRDAVVVYNDCVARSPGEVADLLRTAAKNYREEHS
jgi:hypothetical protein